MLCNKTHFLHFFPRCASGRRHLTDKISLASISSYSLYCYTTIKRKVPKKSVMRTKSVEKRRRVDSPKIRKIQQQTECFVVHHYQTVCSAYFRFGAVYNVVVAPKNSVHFSFLFFLAFITMYAQISGRSWICCVFCRCRRWILADFSYCCNRAALFIDMKLMNRLVCRPLTEIIRKGGRRVHNLKERIFQVYSEMFKKIETFSRTFRI